MRSLLALLFILAGLAGCDLFDTRDPEPPESGRSSWEIPRVPQDVLTNMSSALFERNAVNYLLSFQDADFEFIADPDVLLQDPSLESWNYADEAAHITRLLSEGTLPNDSALAVVFLNLDQTILGDSAEIVADYELRTEIALSGAPGPMAGNARFMLRVGEAGYWKIYRWTDRRTEDSPTWSDLKSLVQ